jgi:hypothetical protein
MKNKGTSEIAPKGQKAMTLTFDQIQTKSFTIKYLPSEGITTQPEKPVAKDTFKITITNVTATRIPDANVGSGVAAVEVVFQYKIEGDLPPLLNRLGFGVVGIDASGNAGEVRVTGEDAAEYKNKTTYKFTHGLRPTDVKINVFMNNPAVGDKLASLDGIEIKLGAPKNVFTLTMSASPQIEWTNTVGNFQRFKVQVPYTMTGQAGVIDQLDFYIDFTGKDGKKKRVLFGARAPRDLKPNDTLTFEQGVDLVDLANTKSADIVIVFTPNGKSPQVVASKANLNISGSPMTTPAGLVVELSNPVVEQMPGKQVKVSVEYKFTGGMPDPNNKYQLFCNVTGGKAALLKAYDEKGGKLAQQGMLSATTDGDLKPGSAFTVYMKEVTDKNAPDGMMISKIPSAKGKVTGMGDPATPLPFNVIIASTAGTYRIDKKGTHIHCNAQFSVKQGTAKQDAFYRCTIKVLLANNQTFEYTVGKDFAANQFKGNGTFQIPGGTPLLVAGLNSPNYTVTIYELVQGQAPAVVATMNGSLEFRK